MNKTVLLVGQTSSRGGLAASYKRAFSSVGLRVVDLDLEAKRRALVPLGKVGQRLLGHVEVTSVDAKANRVLATTAIEERPRLVVVMCNEAVRAGTLLQIKTAVPEASIVNIFPDTLHNMRDNVIQCLPAYDLFCTHTKAGVPHLERFGAKAMYLPLAADPSLHHPEELTAAERRELGCDVVYVGNWRPEREALLERLAGHDFAIWGANYWKRYATKGSFVSSRWRGRELTGAEYSKAHLAAKIGLNPIDPMNLPGHNQRLFEVPACGAFSLVTRTAEVTELFTEGETVACFDGADELVDKVRYYLAHADERRRIAERAHEHVVKGGHTYVDRVRSILTALGMRDLVGG